MNIKLVEHSDGYDWTDIQLNYLIEVVLEYGENYVEYSGLIKQLNEMDHEREMSEMTVSII